MYRAQDYSEAEYIGFIERAVNVPGSYETFSIYNLILNSFVETESECLDHIDTDGSTQSIMSMPRFTAPTMSSGLPTPIRYRGRSLGRPHGTTRW